MGVTGLWKLIDQSGKPVPLDTLENKILAVDISIWLHQVVKGFQDSNGATLPHAHLLGLFHRLCKLMYYRIRPVFVFDGGVPPLKRETIAKRNRNKNKYQNEADKLQHLLLEALAKEKVVQQALGASTSALLNSSPPKKAIQKNDDEENDLFKLPPVQDDQPKDDSQTDITESDESFDEKQRFVYNHNLQAIDVKSSHFQSLPADIRHEILSDIKETRKQSSWGRLHELPVESQSFSSFQMKRLLKRRQVQVELEEAEKEMGGKGLSMAELENLLSEEGVVDPDLATERIASSEHVRYLHVRDITKALKKEVNEKIKKEQLDKIKEEKEDNDEEKKLENLKKEELDDEELDLQRAIQLSLGAPDPLNESSENDTVRLTVEQKKALGSAANSLARHYMIEYGGMNDEDVQDLVKFDEKINTTQEFKFNDESVLFGIGVNNSEPNVAANDTPFQAKEISKKLNIQNELPVDMSDSSSDGTDISSNVDSDFIDVPEMDSEMESDDTIFMRAHEPLPPPFLMNEPPPYTPSNQIEVVINPGQMCSINDDIFADIFDRPSRSKKDRRKAPMRKIESKPSTECDDNQENQVVQTTNDLDHLENKQEEIQPMEKPESDSNASKLIETETAIKVTDAANVMPNSKMQSILNELDNEKTAVTKLSLNDLLGSTSKENDNLIAKKDIVENEPNADEMLTPKKIPQPFFVKKTPPSSTKKSPIAATNETNGTPTKAAKSLSDAFDSIASTSTSAPIDEKQSIEMAANVLREKKSKEELEDIAEMLHQERRDLAAERNKKDRLGVSITEQMSMECMELLRLFGVPYIIAPMEAEAQCAYLNAIELTDGTITDDSDIWLFGGQTVYKNFFDQNKHVLEFKSENIQRLFHLDRQKLIQLSFLVGSDYTEGIHGIGAVTALEVLSIFNPTPEKEGETTQIMSILSSLRKFREWWANKSVAQRASALRSKLKNITISEDFPNARVVEAYLYPTVDENRENFSWGKLEVESIREYAKKTFGWTKKRTDEIILPVVKRLSEKTSQQSIQNYFKVTGVTSRKDLQVSKRVRAALQQMSGDPNSSIDADEVVEKKKAKRKTAKKPNKTEVGADDTPLADNMELEIVQKDEKPKNKAKPKANAKPRRKRKAQKESEHGDSDPGPSTSAAVHLTAGIKKIVLPENPITAPIPQREKEKQLMKSNRLKAIELLKKAKMNKKH